MSSLREQLLADGEYFKRVLGMIPGGYCTDNVEKSASETQSDRSAGGELVLQVDRHDNLRDNLHQKIEQLKSQRMKQGVPLDSAEKKRLKRKLSKAKLRQRRKAAKLKSKEDTSVGVTSVKSETVPKQVYNKDDKMVFSKFDFNESSAKKRKKHADVPTGKNYKVLLKQAKKKKDKISEVEALDKERAQEMTTKEIWKSALLKAEGVKPKDDQELLKKAMKRREQKKKSSQRKWEERDKMRVKQMKDRQDKRAKNIAKKKEGRADKKIKKAKKRGRVVAN